jgi:hypothetical protein
MKITPTMHPCHGRTPSALDETTLNTLRAVIAGDADYDTALNVLKTLTDRGYAYHYNRPNALWSAELFEAVETIPTKYVRDDAPLDRVIYVEEATDTAGDLYVDGETLSNTIVFRLIDYRRDEEGARRWHLRGTHRRYYLRRP